MTSPATLGAEELRAVMGGYRDALRMHQTDINRLNVYPVPDGDTGTNMALTLEAVVSELEGVKAGAGLADVVKTTVFVTDRAFLAAVTDVVLRRLDGVTPCFSALVVKGLASPELLMEVDITAVRSS